MQCLVRWQQQGHLNECEVCHVPWKCGLDQNAAPPTAEQAAEVLAACHAAIRSGDAQSLRRRLSPHVVRTAGVELLHACARHENADALGVLLSKGADVDAARTHAIGQLDFEIARRLTTMADLPPSISPFMEDGRTIFPLTPGRIEAGHPGNDSLVLERVLRGDGGMVRVFHAIGVDINDPRHRFGPEQLCPLQMAIMYAPAQVPNAPPLSGRKATVRALIECRADVDHVTSRGTPLVEALLADDADSALELLYAGASTSLQPPAMADFPDWSLGDTAIQDGSRCSRPLYHALVCFQLTGLTLHVDECFADQRRVGHPAHRTQHCPEMLAGGNVGSWGGGLFAGKDGEEVRREGNAAVQQGDWELARITYSIALMAGVFREEGISESVAPDPEPHKILANRSLVHLRLAQKHAAEEAAADGVATPAPDPDAADAAVAMPRLPRLPDLMDAVGRDHMLGEEPTAEQAARGLRRSQALRALAFADARRACRLAPSWAKAHARSAEAAREIGLACWARADRHGVEVMRIVAGDAFRAAAALEPAGGWVAQAMKLERLLTTRPPHSSGGGGGGGDAGGEEEEEPLGPPGPVQRLLDAIGALAHAGITPADLAQTGVVLPPGGSAALATLSAEELDVLEGQLWDAVERTPALGEKLAIATRRKMQGGTDVPASRELAAEAPRGDRDERWTMSFSTVGLSKNDTPLWALTVMDVTPLPHPHSDTIVGSTMREGDLPPPFATVEEVLLAAIVYPLPNAGPSRRPRQVLLAWRMRGMLDEVRELGSHLGFEAVIEDLETAEAISEAHGTDVEGRNHGPGRS